jgi:Ran GTPase-activating protein (RanGAP) involved in mRNA processing and transport
MQTLTAALRHGALQNLKSVSLDCGVHDEDVVDFMDALERSGCAKRMEVLMFAQNGVGAEGLRTLAKLLCRDSYPALKELRIRIDSFNMDAGVMALAEGLLRATHTALRRLDLMEYGDG